LSTRKWKLPSPTRWRSKQVHRIEEGVLSTATDKKNSPGVLFKEPEHLKRCGDRVAAKKVKDEKQRLLLELPTEEWEPLDADDKAYLVDFYYEEKKREREREKEKAEKTGVKEEKRARERVKKEQRVVKKREGERAKGGDHFLSS
jgi:hypothetical protein